MLLPKLLYGRYRDVKAASRRMLTQLKRGAPWGELGGEMIDTRDVPGLIVIGGPSSLLGGDDHFHVFAPVRAISDAVYLTDQLPEIALTTLFEPMIATQWGFLGLLGESGQRFIRPQGHAARYLQALVPWWDEFDAEGERYTGGSRNGNRLWYEHRYNALHTNIQNCLIREGFPKEELWDPLPPGGIAAVVATTRAGITLAREDMH